MNREAEGRPRHAPPTKTPGHTRHRTDGGGSSFDMYRMKEDDWRCRPMSKRRRVASVFSTTEDSFRAHSIGRVRECYNFFADFWKSTPHPFAQMTFVLVWAAVVVTLNDAKILDGGIALDSSAGRTLTTILAFLIVFRTNQSYNRWWEGRILWGRMHSTCVELTQQSANWIENPQLATRIMHFSIAFAYAVKQILRREQLRAQDLDGIVDALEVERMNRLALPVVPYYCLDVIRQCIKKGLKDHPQTHGVQAVARGIDIPVSQLSVQYADMARVRNTLQPDCFRVMLHMFTVIYLLLLPVLSYGLLGYWVIVEVLLTSYLMLGLQLAASDLEDPFGYDLSDLELNLYVANIANQCRAAFYLGEKDNYDLTLDGGGAGADSMPFSELREAGNTVDCSSTTEPMGNSRGSRGGKGSGGGGGSKGSANNGSSNNLMGWPSSPSPDTSAAASLSPSGSATEQVPLPGLTAGGDGGRGRSSSRTQPPKAEKPREVTTSGGAPSSRADVTIAPSFCSSVAISEVLVPPSASSAGGSGFERGRSRDRYDGLFPAPSGTDRGSSGGGRIATRLSIRQRAQEDVAPRRRSKSRPGRGKAPVVEEGSFATPPPPELRKYNFEHQETAMHAEVV